LLFNLLIDAKCDANLVFAPEQALLHRSLRLRQTDQRLDAGLGRGGERGREQPPTRVNGETVRQTLLRLGINWERVEALEHRVQMLLGICAAKGVLPLEFKPAHSVGELLTQHLDELEGEAERKGGILQVLDDHFAKVYKVASPHRPAPGLAA
jgi:hypothetical protein